MTLIKTAALLSTLLLTAAPPPAAAGETPPAAGATLTLEFQGIKRQEGRILASLVDSEAAYNGKDAGRRLALDVSGPSARTVISGLRPGRYAVRAFHDLDGDGKMATNPFGMPTEPFAFSNNARGGMGPARWTDAAFEVGPDGAVHTITID
jgi:uncharacterized protein (DUF2141 family)